MLRSQILALLTATVVLLNACATQTHTVSIGTLRSVQTAVGRDGEAEVLDGGGERLVLHAHDRVTSLSTLSGTTNLPRGVRVLGDLLALCGPTAGDACPLRHVSALSFESREVSWARVSAYGALLGLNAIAGVGLACAFGAIGCEDYSDSTRGAIAALSLMAPLALIGLLVLDSMGR